MRGEVTVTVTVTEADVEAFCRGASGPGRPIRRASQWANNLANRCERMAARGGTAAVEDRGSTLLRDLIAAGIAAVLAAREGR